MGACLGVHFAPTLPLALHQLLQGKLRVGRRVASQTGGAPRGVHAAQLALLPGAHGAAPAARFAHYLRACLGELWAQRLALRGTARAAENHLGQRGTGQRHGEDQQAAARVQQHRYRHEVWGNYHGAVEGNHKCVCVWGGGVGGREGAEMCTRTGEAGGLGGLLGPTHSQVCSRGQRKLVFIRGEIGRLWDFLHGEEQL